MMRVSLVWWGIVSPPGRATPTAREPVCPYMTKTEADRLCLSGSRGFVSGGGRGWLHLEPAQSPNTVVTCPSCYTPARRVRGYPGSSGDHGVTAGGMAAGSPG